MFTVASIDVGIIHLGLVWASFDADCNLHRLEGCALVDLTSIVQQYHQAVRAPCVFQHTNTLTDRLNHFYALYASVLDAARFIFIEQQPIMGHTAVEQLVFAQYREKAILIHPCVMHKLMNIHWLGDYELRKRATERIAKALPMSTAFEDEYKRLESARVHDIADAVCIMLTGMVPKQKMRQLELDETHRKEIREAKHLQLQKVLSKTDLQDFFASFLYREK